MWRAVLLASLIVNTASVFGQEVAVTALRSVESERQLGSSIVRDIEAHVKLIEDHLVTEYLAGLVQNIVQHSGSRIALTVKLIDSSETNAFVLPGGYLYVSSGVITASDSEAELASVLAHEIAHVTARHHARIQRRRRLWRVTSRCSGPAGFAVQVAGFLATMRMTRDAEREADSLGLQYLYASGYDPAVFVAFLEKVQARDEERENLIVRPFVAHPMARQRINRAKAQIA